MMRRILKDTRHIYLALGATDFRKQTAGLAAIVNMQFQLDPFADQCAFLFCNHKKIPSKYCATTAMDSSWPAKLLARANKLDVYEYLKYLLMEMPNNAHLEHPEVIDWYLPWSGELPEECRLEHKHKKCFKK